MNSFYRKIALACLVSLTANQAAQAFQFSDVLNWMKENKKTTAAIVYLGLVAACIYMWPKSQEATRIGKRKIVSAFPVEFYGSEAAWKERHRQGGFMRTQEPLVTRGLSGLMLKPPALLQADLQTTVNMSYDCQRYLNWPDTAVTVIAKDKQKIVGVLQFDVDSYHDQLKILNIKADTRLNAKKQQQVKEALVAPLLDTDYDLHISPVEHLFLKNILDQCDGGAHAGTESDAIYNIGGPNTFKRIKRLRAQPERQAHIDPVVPAIILPVQEPQVALPIPEPVIAAQQPAQIQEDQVEELEVPEQA